MTLRDEFTGYYEELLEGSYDCLDRIVLNAYYSMGQNPGGFRTWWRKLHGSDENLDNAHIQRYAGRLKRRIEAYASKNHIPFIFCESGERKHLAAEKYLPADSNFKGLFLVIVGRAPAPVWEVDHTRDGRIRNIYRKKKWPYINHYYFHLMDPEWGHITVRMSGYPPFGAQVIANGHEWVERRAVQKGLSIIKEGNCYVGGPDFQALNRIAQASRAEHAIGRLIKACDRWLYSSCLCFALDLSEQEKSGFKYSYSTFQMEYSRNLLFKSGDMLDEVYEKLLERTWRMLDVKKLRTIFGRKKRPHTYKRRGLESGRLDKVIDRPSHNLTVFKLHFGKTTLKIYDKGDRVLRIEVVAHNAGDLKCGKTISRLPALLTKMEDILVNFLNTVQAAHISYLDDGTFDSLSMPSQRGEKRLAGVALDKPRMRAAIDAVLALSTKPDGFTSAELAQKTCLLNGWSEDQYSRRNAYYDITKLQGKNFLKRVGKSHRYFVPAEGVRLLFGALIVRDKVIKPILASLSRPERGRPPKTIHPVDVHYDNLRRELLKTFETLGLAA